MSFFSHSTLLRARGRTGLTVPSLPYISRRIQLRSVSDSSTVPPTRGRPRKKPLEGASDKPPRPKKKLLEDNDVVVKQPRIKRMGNRYTPHPDSPEDKTVLPPRESWRSIFAWVPVNDRVSLSNPDTSATVAENFVPEGSKDRVIIEAFPGPGQLTRSLLALPKERLKKLIVLEGEPKYLDYLRPLAALDPRITIIPHTASAWDTFDLIEEQGLLNDVEILGWDEGVHPRLQFISHLPLTGHGEQLIAQFLRLIPNRNWLFKYGRVQMNLILSEYVWGRMTATGSSLARCKLSVMASATADCQIRLSNELQPYAQHFHPIPWGTTPGEKQSAVLSNRKIGVPFQAVTVTPLEKQVIDPTKLDIWDFCVRRLFVRRATPLEKCIEDLGPGAKSLLPKLHNKIDKRTKVRELTVSDWAEITREFDEWPFAPTDLGINDAMLDDYQGRGLSNDRR